MTQHAVAIDMMETRNHVDRTHRFALVTGMRDGNGFICIVRGPDSINIEGFRRCLHFSFGSKWC